MNILGSLEEYQKPVVNLKKEDFLSKVKNGYPHDEEIERTLVNIKKFNF